MTIEQYIDSINKRYRLGNATEHTFHGDLQQLIEKALTSEETNQEDIWSNYVETHLLLL